ncbi:pentapeptide repeat-containing protein [Agrobacterium fabrum]
MPIRSRNKWKRPFNWPPETWEFTPGMQKVSDIALAFLFLLLVSTIICAVIIWPVLIYRTFHNVSFGTTEDVRNTLLAVGALIGVPFLIWRTMIAARQTNISREGHYTGLFTKAVEQLGSEKTVKRRDFKPVFQRDDDGEIRRDKDGNPIPQYSATGDAIGEYSSYEATTTNYEIRLGAIYALERIMQDSRRDAWPIYLTLSAYIQNNGEPRRRDVKSGGHTERNNSDIAEIFNVLDRYSGERGVEERIDFEGIHIPSLRFMSGNFQRVHFENCSVAGLTLSGHAQLMTMEKCLVGPVDIRQAEVYGLQLVSSELASLVCNDASFRQCGFSASKIALFIVLNCDAADSHFSLDSDDCRIVKTNFERTRFTDADVRSSGARRLIRLSTFTDCTFVECDFSYMDLVDSVFSNCIFERCNVIRTTGISEDHNRFVDNFDESALNKPVEMLENPFELRWAWTSWRERKRPDDYKY